MSDFKHIPVLLEEVVEALDIREGEKFIDATLGGGGHTGEIVKHGGIVLGLDQDQSAIEFVKKNFQFLISNFKLKLVRGNFVNIKQIAGENGFEKVSGVLFDLGFSSYQMDSSGKG